MTNRANDKAWSEFVAWCRARRLQPLPAHPWTLAAYARWCEVRDRYPGVVRRVRAIARKHVLACQPAPDRHPIVMRTLRLIERRERVREQRSALFPDGSETAVPTPRTGKSALAEPSRRRGLAASPRLVSRRPATP